MDVADPIDLLDGYFYAGDPYPTYAWLREHDPVHWDERNQIWGISRYADVLTIEKDTARYTSSLGSRPATDYRESMINMDDPGHQQQRRVVAREFTPRAVKAIEDDVRRVVTWLIDQVCEQGWCDAVHDLAAPLPSIVIGQKLGYPDDHWPKVLEWAERTMLGGSGPRSTTGAAGQAIAEYTEVTLALIAERRSDPAEDLISRWCHTDIDGRFMTDAEIVHECLLLLNGGAETTRSTIGQTCLDLIEHRDQRQILLDDPTVIGETAVEEFIRWVTPILNMRRTATVDHDLHGRAIAEGDEILLMYSSANRDADAFDDPDRYDVTRQVNNHLSFGFGTHFCLGASLARLEIKVMFEELLRRLGDYELENLADPRFQPGAFARGLKDLTIRFTPSAPEG